MKGKKVAIVGFGEYGWAHALNLRDSGVDVVVSPVNPSLWDAVTALDFKVQPLSIALADADVVVVMPKADYHSVAEHIKEGTLIIRVLPRFNSYMCFFGECVLLSTNSPGFAVRHASLINSGLPVHMSMGKAGEEKVRLAFAYARAIGAKEHTITLH